MTLFIVPQSSQLLREFENRVLVAAANGSPHFLQKAAALSRNFQRLFYDRALHVISRLPRSYFSACGKLHRVWLLPFQSSAARGCVRSFQTRSWGESPSASSKRSLRILKVALTRPVLPSRFLRIK